ncbi:hypothetical protein D0C36_20070 [Mucilaginibacter conchicola]|uniref:Uncharacterized protein n=1 Tax=Mucilaginibacter conchicola TaxID=2303333 RepID=A0A372NSB2_9SPHI|nr:hypothetical protein D0C36_20070 [Mucilaginibacter conchicola]
MTENMLMHIPGIQRTPCVAIPGNKVFQLPLLMTEAVQELSVPVVDLFFQHISFRFPVLCGNVVMMSSAIN